MVEDASQPIHRAAATGNVKPNRVRKPRPPRPPKAPAPKKLRASCIQLVCPECGKTFEGDSSFSGVRSNYARHLRTHSGARPYSCTYCTDAFTTSSNLRRHQRMRHPQMASPQRGPQLSHPPRGGGSGPAPAEAAPPLPPPLSLPPCRRETCTYCGRAFAFRATCAMHERGCPARRKALEDGAPPPAHPRTSPRLAAAATAPQRLYQCEDCEVEVSSATKLRRHRIYYCPFRLNINADPFEDVVAADERALVSSAARAAGLHYYEDANASSAEGEEEGREVHLEEEEYEDEEETDLYYAHPGGGGVSSSPSDEEPLEEDEREQLQRFLRWRDHHEEEGESDGDGGLRGDRKRARPEAEGEDEGLDADSGSEVVVEDDDDTALLPVEDVVVDYKRRRMTHKRQRRILRKRLLAQQQRAAPSLAVEGRSPPPPPAPERARTLPESIRHAAAAILTSVNKERNMRVRVARQARKNIRAAAAAAAAQQEGGEAVAPSPADRQQQMAAEKQKVAAQYAEDGVTGGGKKPHTCPIGSCLQRFASRRRWLAHVMRRHPEEYDKYKNAE